MLGMKCLISHVRLFFDIQLVHLFSNTFETARYNMIIRVIVFLVNSVISSPAWLFQNQGISTSLVAELLIFSLNQQLSCHSRSNGFLIRVIQVSWQVGVSVYSANSCSQLSCLLHWHTREKNPNLGVCIYIAILFKDYHHPSSNLLYSLIRAILLFLKTTF